MGRYVLRRLFQAVPVLLATTFIIYVAVYALPGDPVQALAGPNAVVTPAAEHAMRVRYHLDQPLLVQYWHYLVRLVHGDFGVDFQGTSVASIINVSWPVTVQLALTTWLLQALIGVALGTWAGIRNGRVEDFAVLAGTTLVIGVPYFVIAYVAQIVLGVKLGWFPASGTDSGWPLSYILPASVLALFGLPEIARLTRTSLVENLHADYVDTATAKGLPRWHIILRHVLRNSLLPVVSVLGVSLGYLLSGTVLIEGIFNMPGMGYQVFTGVSQHNGPVVVGISTLLVIVFLAVNLIVDLLYGILDPRIRLG